MKRYLIFIIVIAIFGCKKTEKKEYYVKPIEVVCDYPFNDTAKWAITCRVWGLLKYYHPNVTSGKLDWDKVLLDKMDKINEAQTPEMVNVELMNMIHDAGKYKGTVDKKWNDSLNMNVSLCWLDHSFINNTIRQELRKIASFTVKQPSYYIGSNIIGALAFDNEKDYSLSNNLDYKYSMLALFRYWNAIYYFFPYKYLMDHSWDITLEEFIPLFINSSNLENYRETILKLAAKINDGHASTTVSPAADLYSRITVLIDTLTVIRIPPEESMLKRGDIILSVKGKEIKNVRDSLEVIIPSSNRHFTNKMINSIIDKSILEGCEITVLREQEKLSVKEEQKIFAPKKISQPFYPISADIAYFNLDLLKDLDISVMIDSMEHTRCVIFDLRNYPGLSINNSWKYLFCRLTSERNYQYGRVHVAHLSHAGSFYIMRTFSGFPDEKDNLCKKYNGKVVVLINEITISAAETLAMSFKIHGATLIGRPTAGANGDVARLKLPGGIEAGVSSLGFYYPDGFQMQRKGVIPDIEVYPTMESIIEGKDEILEEAIKYTNSLK